MHAFTLRMIPRSDLPAPNTPRSYATTPVLRFADTATVTRLIDTLRLRAVEIRGAHYAFRTFLTLPWLPRTTRYLQLDYGCHALPGPRGAFILRSSACRLPGFPVGYPDALVLVLWLLFVYADFLRFALHRICHGSRCTLVCRFRMNSLPPVPLLDYAQVDWLDCAVAVLPGRLTVTGCCRCRCCRILTVTYLPVTACCLNIYLILGPLPGDVHLRSAVTVIEQLRWID